MRCCSVITWTTVCRTIVLCFGICYSRVQDRRLQLLVSYRERSDIWVGSILRSAGTGENSVILNGCCLSCPHAITIVSPFGGSAAVLINRAPSPVETYNDVDSEVVNFFSVLRTQPEELVRQIGLTPFSREEYALAIESNGSTRPKYNPSSQVYRKRASDQNCGNRKWQCIQRGPDLRAGRE